MHCLFVVFVHLETVVHPQEMYYFCKTLFFVDNNLAFAVTGIRFFMLLEDNSQVY